MSDLFISDLHLSGKRDDLCLALTRFLDTFTQDNTPSRLFLLGDIFDAWVGDDVIDPALHDTLTTLKSLSDAGVKLYFQHGNRDFLVGEAFAKLVGAELLPESQIITLPSGDRALIMHGDQLCTDDIAYQAFRAQVRSPEWQKGFLAMTPAERIAFAQKARSESQSAAKEKSDEIMDVNTDAVANAFDEAKVDLMIHGHTHRPKVHQLDNKQRIVLGDWDTHLWYLLCDESGCKLSSEAIV